MLNWVIVGSNWVPFCGEVHTCLLVNRHWDDPSHFAQVTKQPLGCEGLLAIYQTLFDLGSWVRDERRYIALPIPAVSLKKHFIWQGNCWPMGTGELRKRGCSFNCKCFLRVDVLKLHWNSRLQSCNSCSRTLNVQQIIPIMNLPFPPENPLGYLWGFCLCPILFCSVSLGEMPHTWGQPNAAGVNCSERVWKGNNRF